MRENFNPLRKIFQRPEKGSPLEQDFESMETGFLHNSGMFDEEADSNGGEAINPVTGKLNKNIEVASIDGLNTLESDIENGEDVMGDIIDPSKMTLEELIRTQNQ